MKKWLELADIAKGPIFRGIARWSAFEDCADAQSTNLILKRLYAAAGLDPADFSARGLRASFTEAARRGDSLPEAMQESQHESSPTSGGQFCAREGGEARLISAKLDDSFAAAALERSCKMISYGLGGASWAVSAYFLDSRADH